MDARDSRLSRSDFLRQGLDVLAAEGPRSLTAARMVRELGVTTGSFYWHFKTIDDFRDELKRFWRNDIIEGIIKDAREQAEAPANVLEKISEIVRHRGTYRYDAAMREWAKTDGQAANVVASADAVRGNLIAGTFMGAGVSKAHARDKSNLFGAAWLGSQDMKDPEYRFRLMGMITRESE